MREMLFEDGTSRELPDLMELGLLQEILQSLANELPEQDPDTIHAASLVLAKLADGLDVIVQGLAEQENDVRGAEDPTQPALVADSLLGLLLLYQGLLNTIKGL